MKLAYFDDYQVGIVKGDKIVNVTDIVADIPHGIREDIMNRLIERFDAYRGKLEAAAAKSEGVPLASVRLRQPLPAPSSVYCMAVNYNDGIVPSMAIDTFHKSPSSIIGPEETMVLQDIPATIFEGEGELAVVIGKRAENVSQADAMNYIFGYTNLIDGSARDLPDRLNIFFQMKSRATYCPIGPYIATADEIRDPHDLNVKLWVNGDLMQDYSTSDMNHKIPACISFLSHTVPLMPGDIIACGTHHAGLSAFMDGDVVELETKPLGRLRINIRDDLKRTWSRETRGDRKGMNPPTTPQLTGKYAPEK